MPRAIGFGILGIVLTLGAAAEGQEGRPEARPLAAGRQLRRPIAEITLRVDAEGWRPQRTSVPTAPATSGQPTAKVVGWFPSNLSYRRPYFEELALERHGLSRGPIRQPAGSAVRFFATASLLPVWIVIRPPGETYDHRAFGRSGSPIAW